jgi:hypothetical protein
MLYSLQAEYQKEVGYLTVFVKYRINRAPERFSSSRACASLRETGSGLREAGISALWYFLQNVPSIS